MSETLLKASEVAKRYEVSPYTVKKWIRDGLFPDAKLEETVAGSVWLIPESNLEGFIKPEIGRPRKGSK